jgi:hypothetical protein
MGGSVSSQAGKQSDFVERWFGVPSKNLMPGNKKAPTVALNEVRQMLEKIQNSACNSPNRRDPILEAQLLDRVFEKRGDLNLASNVVTEQQLEQIFKNDPQFCGKSTGRLFPTLSKKWEEDLNKKR